MLYKMKYTNGRGQSITFSRAQGLWISEFSLLSGIPVNLSTSQSINQIGASVESQVVEPKTSTVKGFVQGDGKTLKQRIINTVIPLDTGKIVVNDEYSIDVYVEESPIVDLEIKFPRFEFSVTAAYPFWERTTKTSVAMSGLFGMFRFPWNITEEYKFGEMVESYFTSINNKGHVPTFYSIEIVANGTTVNPVISDALTGSFIKLNKTLTAGERINIDAMPDSLKVVSSIDGDIEGLIDIESDLFSLPVGSTTLKYDAEEGRANLAVTLKYSDKLAGVVV